MFELLVPAEKAQLDRVNGDKKAYDLKLRPRLMAEAIEQLQDAGVEPDVWKIEGLDRREDCEEIVGAARRQGRDRLAASSWGGAKTTGRYANGSRLRPRFRALSGSLSAGRVSGIRWSTGARRRSRGRPRYPRLPAAIAIR